jgi:hypothetical protein
MEFCMAGLGIYTYSEVVLQGYHLPANQLRLEHGNGGLLKWNVGTTIEVRTARADPDRL